MLSNTSTFVLIATSKGSTSPVIESCTMIGGKARIDCEAPNRRVEISVAPKHQ